MPNFVKGRTFTSTEELTNTKLHELVENASLDNSAVTSLTALADPIDDTDQIPISDTSASAIKKAAGSNFLRKNASAVFDAQSTRISNVPTPVNSGDAVPKSYADAIAVAAGNLPSVNQTNNGAILRVVNGVWNASASNAVSTVQIQDAAVTGAKLESVTGLTAGVYGSSTAIPQVTVDAKGRITAVTTQNTVTFDLNPSPAGTYGAYNKVPVMVVNAKGQVTSVTLADIITGAQGGSTDKLFWENDQTMTANYTVTANRNAFTAGPITINAGVTLTIPSGCNYSIL